MTYFTFPLCLLAYLDSPEDRIDTIINYCCGELGKAQVAKLRPHQVTLLVDDYVTAHNLEFDNSLIQIEQVIGAKLLNVVISDLKADCLSRIEASSFVTHAERLYGGSPLVFVGASLLWGLYQDNNPSWREFSTLAAVKSIICMKYQ